MKMLWHYDMREKRHLQYICSGCGSGGAKMHSTCILRSISRAKPVNSARCISRHTYSPRPRFSRASWVGHDGTERMISSSRSSIVYPTIIAQGKWRKARTSPARPFSVILNLRMISFAAIPATRPRTCSLINSAPVCPYLSAIKMNQKASTTR